MPAQRPDRPLRLQTISEDIGGRLLGSPDVIITGLSSLAEAGPQDLGYVASDRFLKAAGASKAAALIVARELSDVERPQIVVPNPALAFVHIAQRYFADAPAIRGISDHVVRGHNVHIGSDAAIAAFVTLGDHVRIGARVVLYPGVCLGDDVSIGDDSILYPHVTVLARCTIGARVIIHSGTVIGSDGFGYVQHEGRHHKIPQLGTVHIEDDVEVGANVTVDRATFGETRIRRGTKIDNLVQVAHNVTIGEHSILVAQVGVAGSTRIGNYVMIGGQAGLADHLEIGDQVMIAARSGVNRNVASRQIVSGAPVMPHEIAVKAHAVLPRLPELRQQIRELQHRLDELRAQQAPSPRPARRKKAPTRR